MTYHRAQWGYTYGGGSAWWFLGVIAGGSLVLAGPMLIEMIRGAALIFAGLFCLALPVTGVFITRCIQRHREKEAKKRARKLRGPTYADYAYIL